MEFATLKPDDTNNQPETMRFGNTTMKTSHRQNLLAVILAADAWSACGKKEAVGR
jgi:hypothetical protein